MKIIIQDINVLTEIRHFIEEKGWYDECSLNKKLLRSPLDCFAEICIDENSLYTTFSSETKKAVKEISSSDSNIQSFLNNFSKEGLKTFLMSASKEVILSIIHLLPFGGLAKTAFDFLEKTIKGA